MNKKTIGALVTGAALLGAAFLVTQGPAASSDDGLFIIIIGAVSALLVGGVLRRR